MVSSREIRLASRPDGPPTPGNFSMVDVELPEPGEGQVLVRNLFMSVDPYMRGRMNDAKSYIAPFELGKALDGGAVGEVVTSHSADLPAGTLVLHGFGWREHVVANAARFHAVDPAVPSVSAYLGALGMPGLTAYVGVLDIAAMRPGEAVFVSGAAGAVGAIAGQIATLRGASRVIGSAGSDSKVEYLRSIGFDAAFNYRDGPVRNQLKDAAPEGIDVYFDNVGGEHLEAALSRLRQHGRVALCGAVSHYNDPNPTGPRNLTLAIGKRLTLRGFLVGDHSDREPAFAAEMAQWLRSDRIHCAETVMNGLVNAPGALMGLLRGENTGKMVVRL